jgi:hypothetical protein
MAMTAWLLSHRRLGFACALAVVLVCDALAVFDSREEGGAKIATEDSLFMQRVRALPVGDRLDNLIVASDLLRYVWLRDAEGRFTHEETGLDIDRHLERRWLGAFVGMVPQRVLTVGEAIDYERSGAGTGAHDLRAFGQIVYTAALRPQLPDATVEELRTSDLSCDGLDKRRNRTVPIASQAEYDELVTSYEMLQKDCERPERDGFIIALSNQTNNPLYLPGSLLLTVKTVPAQNDLALECANNTESILSGRRFRPLSPDERVLVRCRYASRAKQDAKARLSDAVRALNSVDGWRLQPSNNAYGYGGDLLGIHDNLPELRSTEDGVAQLLATSSCRERRSCFAEGMYAYHQLYDALSLVVAFVHGALLTAFVAAARPHWLPGFAYVTSGTIFALYFYLIYTMSFGGILAEMAIWYYRLHTGAALAGVWLTYGVTRRWSRPDAMAGEVHRAGEEAGLR